MAINLEQLGIKLKKLREDANLNQKHIADFLSVDQSLISKFEKGERNISSDMLTKLATLYCCPLTLLVSDETISSSYNFSFRTTSIGEDDLMRLSVINKIALNQAQMDKIAGGIVNDR